MSKQMLKDFHSFMEEVSSGKGSEWSHEHGSDFGWEDGMLLCYIKIQKKVSKEHI